MILTAVQMESRAMLRVLGHRGCRFHTVGIGAKYLPGLATDVSLILMCGVAGALDPALQIGDVVMDLPQTPVLRYPQEPDLMVIRNPALGGTSEPASVKEGVIFTSPHIIASPAEKTELFTRTGALAVDMEQSIVRVFAEAKNIPVIGLRAISDTAHQVLDPAVVHLVTDGGKPRPVHIAALLIRRPAMIPYLRQLGINTKIAINRLGKAAVDLVDKLTHNQED